MFLIKWEAEAKLTGFEKFLMFIFINIYYKDVL